MALKEKLVGKSGALYLLNPMGGRKYTYTKYSSCEVVNMTTWEGPRTIEDVEEDVETVYADKFSVVSATVGDRTFKYEVDEIGVTKSGESVIKLLEDLKNQYGMENVKICTANS